MRQIGRAAGRRVRPYEKCAMATTIAFNRDFHCEYGVAEQISPLIRRVVARNPGPFTFFGTGTYIIGHGEVAVIDPGPDLPGHIEAVLAATAAETITHILVTHTHPDHSPASAAVKRATGATTHGFGPHGTSSGSEPGGDGADRDFVPDARLGDGDSVEGNGWTLEAVHTPGHTSNHLCFALAQEKVLFSGDHVMGWSTTVISPPDGNMADYMASLEKLLDRDDRLYWPTHGPAIADPKPYVRSFIAHRRDREREIMACLDRGIDNIDEMVKVIYAGIAETLHGAAARSLEAHLIYMVDTGRVSRDGESTGAARFAKVADI